MPWVVVLDTNILLSAVGWGGIPFRCVELARTGVIHGATCPELMTELAEKLVAKLDYSWGAAQRVVANHLTFLRQVQVAGTLQVISADLSDNVVLECAVAGGATHIVTGDKKHLIPLHTYQGIQIVSAREFLELIQPS